MVMSTAVIKHPDATIFCEQCLEAIHATFESQPHVDKHPITFFAGTVLKVN